jgi:hypothetical protein
VTGHLRIYLCHWLFMVRLLAWNAAGLPRAFWVEVPLLFAAIWCVSQAILRLMRKIHTGFLSTLPLGE